MNTKRNDQAKAIYKKKNLLYVIRITKINSLLREIPSEIVFLRRLHTEKNDETFGKLLISKDGSPAVRIDEEKKTSKFMMETKIF